MFVIIPILLSIFRSVPTTEQVNCVQTDGVNSSRWHTRTLTRQAHAYAWLCKTSYMVPVRTSTRRHGQRMRTRSTTLSDGFRCWKLRQLPFAAHKVYDNEPCYCCALSYSEQTGKASYSSHEYILLFNTFRTFTHSIAHRTLIGKHKNAISIVMLVLFQLDLLMIMLKVKWVI